MKVSFLGTKSQDPGTGTFRGGTTGYPPRKKTNNFIFTNSNET